MLNWPHQDRALQQSRACYGNGVRSWCVSAPPGAGKSHIMREIAIPASRAGVKVHIYVHRVMLAKQTIAGLADAGADFGVIAAGKQYDDYQNTAAPIQVCMLDTVYSRMDKAGFDLPKADIVIADERHQMTGDMATKVFDVYKTWKAKEIGFTATPVGLQGHVDRLICGGSYSELLDCKAHLPVDSRGPESPDTSKLKRMASGEYSSKSVSNLMRVPTIFGRVFDYWQILNPNQRPAIGYAPGVPESKWFVDEFRKKGIPCCHIDGDRTAFVTKNPAGKLVHREFETDDSTRQEVMDGSREGRYKIVWNRFVLREAIDMPWLYHVILATAMGAESTYLQSTGRVLRYFDQYPETVCQDHGGNIDRHGLPNEEREWTLGDTHASRRKARQKKIQDTKGDEAEPICCPKCNAYRTHGQKCHACGYMHKRSVRMVRQLDGELVKKVGRVEKYKRPKTFEDHYRSALYAMHATGGTVGQAVGIAKMKTNDQGGDIPVTFKQHIQDNWSEPVRKACPWIKGRGHARKS